MQNFPPLPLPDWGGAGAAAAAGRLLASLCAGRGKFGFLSLTGGLPAFAWPGASAGPPCSSCRRFLLPP
eukprot:2549444-Pyramimonas_sp.AAC.1